MEGGCYFVVVFFSEHVVVLTYTIIYHIDMIIYVYHHVPVFQNQLVPLEKGCY